MNNIIQKCIDELNGEKRIDYVLGMLETLIELNKDKVTAAIPPPMKFDYVLPPVGETVPAGGIGGYVTPSGLKPIVPTPVSPELIRKLKGGATVEDISILNAPKAPQNT